MPNYCTMNQGMSVCRNALKVINKQVDPKRSSQD
jgi:hypothetical protein